MPDMSPAVRDGESIRMHEQTGDLVVGLLVLVLGLAGLVMASGALDDGMYVFGLSLAVFAAVFDIGLVKRHFDRMESARHPVRQGGGHV
ncbi:MAG: hypothetical protein IT555_17590 [Acetobacteraceae bacterium]|nr:hypothetical protein [Acetobacteraceae bacterium]